MFHDVWGLTLAGRGPRGIWGGQSARDGDFGAYLVVLAARSLLHTTAMCLTFDKCMPVLWGTSLPEAAGDLTSAEADGSAPTATVFSVGALPVVVCEGGVSAMTVSVSEFGSC